MVKSSKNLEFRLVVWLLYRSPFLNGAETELNKTFESSNIFMAGLINFDIVFDKKNSVC